MVSIPDGVSERVQAARHQVLHADFRVSIPDGVSERVQVVQGKETY